MPLNFGDVQRGSESKIYQHFVIMPGNEFVVTNVDTGTVDIKVAKTGGRIYREACALDFVFSPKDEPLGNYIGSVKVFYRDRVEGPIKSISIQVKAVIKSEISVFPDTLFFGILKPGTEPLARSVLVSSTGQPVVIKEIANPAPDSLVLELVPFEEGQRLVAHLHDPPQGTSKWLVTLALDDKDCPYVVIPVYAYKE